MNTFATNKMLGYVYIAIGLAVFTYVTWTFLWKGAIALAALYLVYTGLKIINYPTSRIFFMYQQWRSRF